jgi:hypothetical protein
MIVDDLIDLNGLIVQHRYDEPHPPGQSDGMLSGAVSRKRV